eukprot:gb/GFBE01037576.1/.p1 GENE.gb/GFBE01037576.1/~~gb/GFBE01037576.1/.p1  ORF type:complete len:171 (+),score=41.77 gb/GFBE01037576.1/:1-513(+)
MAPKKAKGPKRTNKPSPLERMQEAFGIINKDDDPSITKEEFFKAMESVGIVGDQAEDLFNRFDPDRSGALDKEEFFSWAAKGTGDLRALLRRGVAHADEAEEEILKVFESWDTDGDGYITKSELERVLVLLNPSFTKKDMTKLMKAADKNGDGKIDYEEFTAWLGDSKKR